MAALCAVSLAACASGGRGDAEQGGTVPTSTALGEPGAPHDLPPAPAAADAPAPAPSDPASLTRAVSTLSEDSKYPDEANPEVDTLHHSLDLSIRGGELTGTDTITFRAATATPTIQLGLARHLKVTSAEVDGRSVTYRASDDAVVFETGRLTADSRHQLKVRYAGRPASVPGPSTRGDYTDGVGWVAKDGEVSAMSEPFGSLTWFPCNDWTADKTLFDARISVDEGRLGLTNGHLTGMTRTADSSITTWHLDHPAAPYQLTIALGDYRWRGVPLQDGAAFNLWYPPSHPASEVDAWADSAKAAHAWLTDKLGPFPVSPLGAVVVNQSSAMETTTLITMGSDMFDVQAGAVLQHELSHEWFGNTVSPRDWRDLWLSEGWAMYLQHLYTKDKAPQSPLQDLGQGCRKSVPAAGQAGDYDPAHFAEHNVYACGAALLEEIHAQVGDTAFWEMARAWPREHAGNAARADFEAFLHARFGRDFTPLTRRWLDNVGS